MIQVLKEAGVTLDPIKMSSRRPVPLVALLSCLLMPLSLSLHDIQKNTSDIEETTAGAGLHAGAQTGPGGGEIKGAVAGKAAAREEDIESVTSPYNDEESASRDVIYSEQGNISGLLLTEMQLTEEVLREPVLTENLTKNSSEGFLTEKSGQNPLTEAPLTRQDELASLQSQVYVVGGVGGALLLLLLLSTVILAVTVRRIHRKLGKISRWEK